MNYPLFRESLGWIATATFALSYLCKTQTSLRRAQAVAALLWIGYGVTTGSLPVVVSNVAVAFMAVAYPFLRRLWEARAPQTAGPAKQSLSAQGFKVA